MEPRQAGATADDDRTRDREYIQFFIDLGIEDEQKGSFLAGLLRNYHVAAAKLDKHLVGYSAAVHAAVSRLAPAASAHEAPEHLWIRVHDRLGFFHDEDRHAQRVVNVGMAFAYRHLEMNAIVAANAQVLLDVTKDKTPDAIVEVDHAPAARGAFVAPGGLIIGTPASPGLDVGRQSDGGAQSLGCGGSVGGSGAAVDSGAAFNLVKTAAATPIGDKAGGNKGAKVMTGTSRTVVIGDGGGTMNGVAVDHAAVDKAPGQADKDGSTSLGGSMVATMSSLASELGGGGAGEPAVVRIAAVDLLRSTQPHITPSGRPLAAVKGVLASIADREDIDDAVRELMTDSLLFFARNHSFRRRDAVPSSRRHTETRAETWTGLGEILDSWWARWEAPPGVRLMAPPGTTGAVRNSGRPARQSRWCYAVDMKGVNEVLQGIARGHSRYFKKSELPDVVSVERIVEKDSLPLTRCVAVMLLMGMMDAEYVGALTQLGSTGRGEHSKNAHISSATCQAFLSSGLTAARAVAPSPVPSAVVGREAHEEDAPPPPDVESFFAADIEPADKLYEDVARAGAQHAAVVAKDNRAVRKQKRHRPPGTAPMAERGSASSSGRRPPIQPRARQEAADEYAPSDEPLLPHTPTPTKRTRLSDAQDGSIFSGSSWELPSSPEHPSSPPLLLTATDVSAADGCAPPPPAPDTVCDLAPLDNF